MQTPVTDAQPVNWGGQVGQGQAGSHRFQVIINIIITFIVNTIIFTLANIIVKIVIIVIVIFNNIIIIVVGDVGANIGK